MDSEKAKENEDVNGSKADLAFAALEAHKDDQSSLQFEAGDPSTKLLVEKLAAQGSHSSSSAKQIINLLFILIFVSIGYMFHMVQDAYLNQGKVKQAVPTSLEMVQRQKAELLKQERLLKRQAEIRRQAELKRQIEIKRQAALQRQAEITKQAALQRQAEIKKQAALQRQAEIKKQAELERDAKYLMKYETKVQNNSAAKDIKAVETQIVKARNIEITSNGPRNVYESPSTAARVVGMLNLDSQTKVNLYNDQWFALDSGGFIMKNPSQAARPLFVVKVDSLNVRSGPGFSHDVQGAFFSGKVITVHDQKFDWFHVGGGRWIHRNGLKPLNPSANISKK